MSNLRRAQPDQPAKTPPAPKRAGLRYAFYAVLGAVGLVALAYFDAGEEPLRPIVQQVEVPATAAQTGLRSDAENGR